MMLIDPPAGVGPHASPRVLRDWLARLAALPEDDPSVQDAISEAGRWLALAPPEAFPPEDLGIITSAYGPEGAGDLRDVVGKPPRTGGGEEEGLGHTV